MAKAVFNEKRCKACGLCVDACPLKIIYINKDRIQINGLGCAELKEDKCIGCGACRTVCPDCAVTVYKEG